PQAAATTASGAATSAAPAVNAAATTVTGAATSAVPTVAAAATASATTVNSIATTITGAATSAAPTVNAATTAVTGTVAASGSAVAAGPYTGKKLNVAYVVNGNLGDKSFFDSGQRGMDRAKAELGMTVKTIELGTDQNKWGPGLASAADGNYDVIICGTFQMEQYISETAAKATNKKFIFFDDTVDYSKGFQNVYSVMYKQNEGSYLAGYMAGSMVQSSDANVQKGTGGGKKVGFLGGDNIPVINDFLAGYKQGAKDGGLKDTDILISYISGATAFSDPAKGKELTLAMYSQGAGIAFNVAGDSGLGLLDAGGQAKRFTIGVDSDQYALLKDSKPDQAQWIVTSVQKRVDNSLYRALRLAGEGTLKYGAPEAIGLSAGGVELADNDNYKKLVPQAIRDSVAAKSAQIASGALKVDTAIK
ncbi:MAG: BMP family ABC transporter substrate-binding protein, partial [Chloroflexota bacterium]|nr:BMP family ABC transporter substrate-binding protein [Chloroflexota bacterium]